MLIRIREQLKRQQGFTLVELMVVIAIIGVLAAVAVPKLANSLESAKIAKVQSDLQSISTAAALYAANNSGKFPTQVSDLVTTYLQAAPKTPDDGTYSIDSDGVVSGTYKGKTYYSDGRTPATSSTGGSGGSSSSGG